MQRCAAEEKIRNINTNSLGKKFSDVINEITLITGLKVDEQYAKPFAVLFSKFLLAYYGTLTCAEIVLAFRLNSMNALPGQNGNGKDTDRIDFYGPNLTIDHVGGVLSRYMQKRSVLASKINEQPKEIVDTPKLSAEEEEMDNKRFCNDYFRKYLNRDFSPISLEYAYMVYDMLDRLGVMDISITDKKLFFSEAQEVRHRELAAPSLDRDEKKEKNRLMEAYMNNEVPESEIKLVKNAAKKLALLKQFEYWKMAGKEIIFDI
jgi:hypothetical protein